MTSLGPIAVNQRKSYQEFQSHDCGAAGVYTRSCPAGTYEVREHSCTWGPNQRICSKPDERLCDLVWPSYSSAAHKSGSTLADAKIECTWKNIPRSQATKENIDKYVKDYGLETRNASTGFNDLMAAFCFQSTSDCMPGIKKYDSQLCSKTHSNDATTRTFCGTWWDKIKGTKEADEYLAKACPAGSDRADCQCVNATKSAEFHELAKKIPFPESCWYTPCRTVSTDSQYRPSSHEGVQCEGEVCINIANMNVSAEQGAILEDSSFNQSQSCEFSKVSSTTIHNPASTANGAPDNNDEADQGGLQFSQIMVGQDDASMVIVGAVGLVVVMLVIIVIAQNSQSAAA